jgi:hypothetical protein
MIGNLSYHELVTLTQKEPIMKHNPVIVYVGTKEQSETFAKNNNMIVFGAATMRDALAQTIFSYPDAIVVNASEDMLLADDTFFHLRSIEHPPIVMLSNMPWCWETEGGASVVVLRQNSEHETVSQTVHDMLAKVA